MQKLNKVKKGINRKQEIEVIKGNYGLLNLNTGEVLETKIKTSKYNYKLSNNKQFMKKFTDRKLNIAFKKDLSLLEKEILFDLLDYFDEENIIDFKRLALDYNYSASKISKAKKGLSDKGLIKQHNKLFYLNPIVGIKSKEINQELIVLFKNTFEKYNIEIKFN